jgi:hypothetical protein
MDMQFRKKPVIIEAVQWFKHGDNPDIEIYLPRMGLTADDMCKRCDSKLFAHGWIKTLEGGHKVCPSDWIITGVKGEKYPCKPDIFEHTYKPVWGN